jgi:hypothetical protein
MKLRKNYADYVDGVLGTREPWWVRSRRRASRVAAPTPGPAVHRVARVRFGWCRRARVTHERRRFPSLSRRLVMADPVDDPQRDEDEHVKDVRDRQKRL